MRWTLIIAVIVLTSACRSPESGVDQSQQRYREPFRPRLHFSPDHNWTNDPNGLVFYAGEYHLYYQYNPLGNRWGHMSWGHAVTKDLLHWQHQPVAIPEYVDENGDSTMIFSGSAVVDNNNTSGLFTAGSGGVVAIYTSHVHKAKQGLRQHQSIAYSLDSGRTFERFDKNPVLDIGLKDFRDPKVFWHEPSQKWIMATVIPEKFKVHLYGSQDLKAWNFLSEFGPMGDTARIWECPDLLPLQIADESVTKWVLIVSNSHPQGPTYVGMQYFVGSFDGRKFIADDPSQYPLYLDFGRDYYAAITYNNVPASDGRTLLVGWANNWAYGEDIPTYPWKSAMALPREVSLKRIGGKPRLVQQPIREYKTLREAEIKDLPGNTNRSIEIEYTLEPGKGTQAGLRILKTDSAQTIIGFDAERSEVYIDRSASGNVSFHPTFTGVDRAPVRLVDGRISLTILVDQSLIEVYVNGGEQVLTTQVFPTGSGSGVEVFSNDRAVGSVKVWGLKSVW